MGAVRKLLGFIIIAAILSAAAAYVVQGRFLNFKYLEQKANAGQFYDQLADVVPELVVSDVHNSSPAAQAALDDIISPQYIQTKVNDFLEQLQAYYREDGPNPTIDLRDVVIQARSAGLVVPPDTELDRPIVFNDPIGLKNQYQSARQTMIYGPVVALVLLLVLMSTLPAPARYRSAGKTIVMAILSLGILYGTALFLPGLIAQLVNSNKDFAAVAPAVNNLISEIGADAAGDFLRIMIVLAVLAAGLFIFSLFGHRVGRSGGQEIKPKRPNPRFNQ